MRLIDREAIDHVLDFPAVIEALARAFAGGFAGPARHHHALDHNSGATQLLMRRGRAIFRMPAAFSARKSSACFRKTADVKSRR